MTRRHFALITLLGAAIGAACGYLAAPGYAQALPAGALLGALMGLGIAARLSAGRAAPAFDVETAGKHDDNLITSARRHLSRDAYRQFFDDKIERGRRR